MKYEESRKKYWKKSNQGTGTAEERKNFKAKCKKCGYEGEVRQMKLEVTIQKARDGRDYLQIMSEDYISVNIVLVSEKITVKDQRDKQNDKGKQSKVYF